VTRHARAAAGLVAAVTLAAAACTGGGIRIELGSPSPSVAGSGHAPPTASAPGTPGGTGLTAPPVETDEEHALPAMRALCVSPTPVGTGGDGSPGEAPPDVRMVASQVEQVRGLEFLRPVVVQPVSDQELASRLEGTFDETYPKAFYDRRTVAWQALGRHDPRRAARVPDRTGDRLLQPGRR
jgi:hypothetical protein